MSNKFVEAIKSMPPSPCDAYDCVCKKKCANEKLACNAFVHYISTSRVVNPLMQFRGDKDRQKVANILGKTHAPTRELFFRLFPEK